MSARGRAASPGAYRRARAAQPTFEERMEAAARARLEPLLAAVTATCEALRRVWEREQDWLEDVQTIKWPGEAGAWLPQHARDLAQLLDPSNLDQTERQLAGWAASLSSYRLWHQRDERELVQRSIGVLGLPADCARRLRRLHAWAARLMPMLGDPRAPHGPRPGSAEYRDPHEGAAREYPPAKTEFSPFDHHRGAA